MSDLASLVDLASAYPELLAHSLRGYQSRYQLSNEQMLTYLDLPDMPTFLFVCLRPGLKAMKRDELNYEVRFLVQYYGCNIFFLAGMLANLPPSELHHMQDSARFTEWYKAVNATCHLDNLTRLGAHHAQSTRPH